MSRSAATPSAARRRPGLGRLGASLSVIGVLALSGGSLIATPPVAASHDGYISLSAPSGAQAGDTVTLTASVMDMYTSSPLVTFTVTSGPNVGTLGTATAASSVATFTYTSATAGTDVVTASYMGGMIGMTVTSSSVSIAWSAPEPTPTPTPTPTAEPTASPTPEPTASPTPEPTASPTPEPTASPTPAPSGEPTPVPTSEPVTDLVALEAPKAGQPATYEASMDDCVDSCTFDWFVDGVFVTSTTDLAPTGTAGISTAGDGGVLFMALSRVDLTLAAGTHDIVVQIESADGATGVVAATVTIAAAAGGAAVTPPPTSTIGGSSGSLGWTAMVGLSLLLIVGVLAAGTMFNAPITTVRRRR
jgi:hypothetical protein